MIKTVRVIEEVTYRSEVRDDVVWTSTDLGINGAEEGSRPPPMARVIEWADAHPHVYVIVNESKSLVFGKDSIHYYGIDRGPGLTAMLGRIRSFQRLYDTDLSVGSPPITAWLARHTYSIYADDVRKLKSGHLVQWDGKYTRNSLSVDFTRASFQDVLERFRAWCDSGPSRYSTERILFCPPGDKRVEDMKPHERTERTVWTGCEHPSRSRKLSGELVCDACHFSLETP